MSWSPSWTSPTLPAGSQMTTPSPLSPTSAWRTPHGTSGLFDTGVAGSAKLGAQPAQSSEPLGTTAEPSIFNTIDSIDTADLLGAFPQLNADTASLPLSGFGNLLQEGNCSQDNLDLLGSIKSEQDALMTSSSALVHSEAASGFHDDDALLGNTSDFLEQFTDLSSYSNDGHAAPVAFDPEQFMREMAEIEEALPSDNANAAVKRAASEALDADEDDEPVFVNPDHNDYTRKAAPVVTPARKRRRVATVTDSDAESVISSTSSFSVVPSSSSSKDHKYIERRRKNNIASRRSRETRKQKFSTMEQQADDLEAKNAALRVKVAELERVTKLMKDALVQQLANAGKAPAAAREQSATA